MIKLVPVLATLVGTALAVGATGAASADSAGPDRSQGGNEAGRGFHGAAIVVEVPDADRI